MENVLDNDVVKLERPMRRKAKKAKWKAPTKSAEVIVKFTRMKYTLLDESYAHENELLHMQEEKMNYD